FLRAHGDVLGLDDPDRELVLESIEDDPLGRRHLRFAQTVNDLPVWPNGLIVELDARGDVDLVSGAFVRTPRLLAGSPTLDRAAAIAAARAAVPNGGGAPARVPSLLVWAPGGRAARLAWKIELSVALDAFWLVLVDATTGDVLTAMNQVTSAAATGSGIDLLGVRRALGLWQDGDQYFLV